MRIVNRREAIKLAIENFISTYSRYDRNSTMTWTKGKPLSYFLDRVAALDAESCSVENLNAALDKDGSTWGRNECDQCGGDFENIIRIGDEPEYDERWQDLCVSCLKDAIEMLRANRPAA